MPYRNGYRVVQVGDANSVRMWAVVYGGVRIMRQKTYSAELSSQYGEVLVDSFMSRREAEVVKEALAAFEREALLKQYTVSKEENHAESDDS